MMLRESVCLTACLVACWLASCGDSGQGGAPGGGGGNYPDANGYCGDGVCAPGESQFCTADCTPSGYCGDGYCSANEDAYTCPPDCGGYGGTGGGYGGTGGSVVDPSCGDATSYPDGCCTDAMGDGGNPVWLKAFGTYATATAIAIDASGNVIVGGYFKGTLDFGGQPLVSAGDLDVFVAKLDPAGNHLWSQRFGDAQFQGVTEVATDAQGNVLVTGAFEGTIDFGGGPLTSVGSEDMFLAKLDSDGKHVFSKSWGSPGPEHAKGMRIDGSGAIYLAGPVEDSIDFGGGVLPTAGSLDGFAVKLDKDGKHLWSHRFGSTGNDLAYDLALGPSGHVFLTGVFADTISFGGGTLKSAGGQDVFVAELDSDGKHVHSAAYGSSGNQYAAALAVDPAGEVTLYGWTTGVVDFGGGPVNCGVADPSIVPTVMFLAHFDAAHQHVWSKGFSDGWYGSSVHAGIGGIAADATGSVIFTGSFIGDLDFGGGPVSGGNADGYTDLFLVKLDKTGQHVWTVTGGTGGGSEVTTSSTGAVVFAGGVIGQVKLGSQSVTAGYPGSVLVASFPP